MGRWWADALGLRPLSSGRPVAGHGPLAGPSRTIATTKPASRPSATRPTCQQPTGHYHALTDRALSRDHSQPGTASSARARPRLRDPGS